MAALKRPGKEKNEVSGLKCNVDTERNRRWNVLKVLQKGCLLALTKCIIAQIFPEFVCIKRKRG